MTKIIADHRERHTGVIEELVKKGFDVEVKQLITADFILQTKSNDDKEYTVGIEKKTQNDFLNSIMDKRLMTQLALLKENFAIPILLIEGSENIYTLRNFHPNAIRGMLASIAIDYQIPIMHTKNYRDTAALIATIAKRLERPLREISLLSRRKPISLESHQELLIETLPGIGPNIAKKLLKEFKTVKNIMNASLEDLKKIDKVGPKKAEAIKKLIDTEYKEKKESN